MIIWLIYVISVVIFIVMLFIYRVIPQSTERQKGIREVLLAFIGLVGLTLASITIGIIWGLINGYYSAG